VPLSVADGWVRKPSAAARHPVRGELIALRWPAVDPDRGELDVLGTMQPDGIVAEPKPRSSRRRVPLGDLAVNALRQHWAAQIERRLSLGAEWRPEGFVFATDIGAPLAPMTLLQRWYAVLRAAELPRMPFHATRHTAATLMLSAGVSPRVAAERLGHATAALTLDRYSHVTDRLRQDAAKAIDAALS
jgi:integrase